MTNLGKMRKPTKIGYCLPRKIDVAKFGAGNAFDFTNGVDIENIPRDVIEALVSINFAPTEGTCLGLSGKGCVDPHTDALFGERTLVWIIKTGGPCYLMVGAGGKDASLQACKGDILVFDNNLLHAWISNSSWIIAVIDITSKKSRAWRSFAELKKTLKLNKQ